MARVSERSTGSAGAARAARAVLVRLAVGAVVWWSMVEGDSEVLAYGLAAVPVVVAVSFWLTGPGGRASRRGGVRPVALLTLVGWLGARAVAGGVDVGRRALAVPSVDVAPHWETYETSLGSPSARVALTLVMNLLPGALSARLDGSRVEVHVISPELDIAATLADLERRLRRAGAR